ncbi:fimbria/pilus periplasmic chaperone [Sphingomonas sp. CARO-RG-8B-R24-01]|uniref:fimbrial biogenesis chaperone n=1 Tax=Sphingomonas sp. CARO-RG-8B-R24-01 TaxID=2914831 RepID=UPI001F5AC3D3|nr:fimbria/pilus periplasmic chaperone [Sphingomonas sp. CARO-RG-8B-R24-01]
MRSIPWIDARWTGRLRAAGLSVVGTVALVPGTANASSFRVSPVTLTLPANRPVGSLTITNGDTAPVAIRVTTYRWTQVAGADVYTPNDDLIASPPIFTTPAKAVQLIRVGLRRAGADAAYRVVLEEIPAPATKGIRIAVNLNLPLYIVADPAAKPAVRWTMRRGSDGALLLEGRNAGGMPLQVTAISSAGPGVPKLLTSAMGVVLPASMRHWNLGRHPDWTTGVPLHLIVQTALGVDEVTVDLPAG